MKLYISGPMHDIPHWNFEAFDDATAWLRAAGHTVSSPAEHDREVNPDWRNHPGYEVGGSVDEPLRSELLIWDIQQILEADGIVKLEGKGGRGAKIEYDVAIATGKPVFHIVTYATGQRLLHSELGMALGLTPV